MGVSVDGVNDVDPVLGHDKLLAFGFNVGFPSSHVTFDGYTISAPFNDNTPLLGPFSGSTLPGVQGDNIQLATLRFTATQTGLISIDVGDQEDRPDITGLFTTLHPRLPIEAYAAINIISTPEPSSMSLLFLGLVIGSFFWFKRPCE